MLLEQLRTWKFCNISQENLSPFLIELEACNFVKKRL